MELELGLKITKTRDDIDSISEYQFLKDTGPVFKSRETNTMFILTAHLKGYKRNNIDINISKDGNKISIKGKKPIQEMVMMGWVMQRKVVDIKGFNKVFKIPYGVNLDKIKANYNEEEWMLNIVMPKLVKGVFGLKIEEIKEQEFDKGRTKSVGETSQKGSKEYEFQHMEESENIIEKIIDDTKKEINEERILKEVGEYKLRIEDGNGKNVREKGGNKDEFEDQSVGVSMSKEIEDASQDKEFEDGKLNSRSVDKRLDDVNRDLIGSTIKNDNEESKLRIKDNKVKDANQIGFEESIIQQSGESKQNEFGEPKCESKVRLKESSQEPFEEMKAPKLDENVVDHIPNNIGCMNQTQLKEEYEKPPFEADVQKTKFGDTIQKGIIKANKEGFDAKITINEEFPKNLPKNSYEESEGLNNQKMQETKNEKEERVSKDVEYFVEKGEGERLKKMHVEIKKGNNTRETMKKEVEEGDNVAEMKGSKGQPKEEEQKEVKKEATDENESLIVEGNEFKEITKEIVQDEEDKTETGIVKLKGEGSTKLHVEPNEPFEEENVNNGIFDGRETKMFHEIEETKDVNENGANIEHSMKKIIRDKYEKIQNEENESFKRNKTKAQDDWFFQEGMSKGRSKENKDAKEDLPIDTREGQKNTKIEKVKGIKESVKESSMKPFEANEDVHKDFEKLKMESKDGDQESVRKEIQNYLPKSTHEQNEGLNVQKRREIKDFKENVVKRKGKEIEHFVEKGEDDRLKSMHVKEMKGNNTIETMHDEIEKSEYGVNESGQQYANENSGKGMYEVSKSETEGLPRHVAEIDGSNEFDVTKAEEKDEVLNEALVESESLMGMVRGEESNHMTKAIVQDDKDKIEYSMEKLKEKGHAKIHFEHFDPFERDMTEEKIEKEIRNQEVEPINELSEKIQNEEDEDLKKNRTKEKDEFSMQEGMSEERFQATKDRKEDFSMKMLESQIDAREGPNDRKMEKTKSVKEESAKVKRGKHEKIQVEENDCLRNDITKRKQNESGETKIVTKAKDQQSLQKEKNKGRNEASKIDSLAKLREGSKDKEIDEQNFVESTTKEELQGFEIETIGQILFKESDENNSNAKEIGTSEREFQSVASTGFKEFEYGNAKDKKQNMTMLPPKFQINQTRESKDGSIKMKENEEVEQNDTLKQEIPLEKELKKGEIGEFLNGKTMREKLDEPKNKYKTQNANDENFKIQGEITKDGIEKERCIQETMKTTQEKEAENCGVGEMKLPKIAACQEAKPSKLQWPRNNQQSTEKVKAIGENEATKDSPKLNIVKIAKNDSLQPQFLDGEENVLQKKKEKKVAKIEDKHASTLQREIGETTQTIEENELKMKGITKPFEKASGSKRVEEKVHDTPNIELQREIVKVASKMLEPSTTVEKPPPKNGERKDPQELTRSNLDYEISKVEEVQKDNEEEGHIHVLEETIYNEEGTHDNKAEFLEASLNNHCEHESGTEEIKEPKNAAYQEAKTSKLRQRFKQQTTDEINRKSEENVNSLPPHLLDEQEEVLHVQEKSDKKEFLTPNILEEERVVKKREGPMVTKNEETNNSSTIKRVGGKSKTKEENEPKMKEITTQFEKASGSKRVEEKVHETPRKKHQRELEEVTSKIKVEPKIPIKGVERKEYVESTSPPNMVNEILKVEEKHEEIEGKKHIQVLEATIAEGKKDRGHQFVQEKNNKKGFQTQKSLEEETIVKKMEEANVAKSEETKGDYIFKRQDGKTAQASKLDKASSGSKRVGENVHETSERKDQRELEEVTSKMRVEQPTTVDKTATKMDNEIPKVKKFRKEEMEMHIQELEATISKEKDIIEQKEDTGVQEIEQCIKDDEEAKQEIDEIKDEEKDYEKVFEEQKEGEYETRGGKKDNAKISKEFFVPLVIAGSAILVTLIAIFVRHRRAKKR